MWLRSNFGDGLAMKNMLKVMTLASATALAACSGSTSLGSSIGSLLGSTPQIGGNANVQQACVAAQPSLVAGAKVNNPAANSIAAYGNAFCGPVLAGTMPTTTNNNSTNWVLGLITQLAPLLIAAV